MPRKSWRFNAQWWGSSARPLIPSSSPVQWWKNNNSRMPSRFSPRMRSTVKYASIAIWLLFTSGAGYTYYLIDQAKKTTPTWREIYEDLKERNALSTHIRDVSGEILATVGGKNEDDVPIEEMNPYLVANLIAVEDQRFWYHNGFDTQAIWWMIWDNLCWILSGSGETRWWSTIGSQLFKENTPKRSWKVDYYMARGNQKIRERVQAGKLFDEWNEAKRFALEWYLNNTYFVGDKQGIAAAAKIIFQKDQKDLTIDECALIVWLAKGPTYYNPFTQETRAEQRTDEVLTDLIRAYANGAFPELFLHKFPNFIVNTQEIITAQNIVTTAMVTKNPTKHSTRPNLIPHATGSYITQAQWYMNEYISSPEDILAIQNLLPWAGYKGIVRRDKNGSLDTLQVWIGWFEITTTIHADIQHMLTQWLQQHLATLDKQWPYPDYPLEWAVVCIDNTTGEILWDVRWRDYKKSELDFRSALTEQWSVIKAVIFATALEMWIIDSLEQVYVDTAITLHQWQYAGITDTLWWTPKNFWAYSWDTLTLGVAWLVHSRNTAPTFVFEQAARLGKGQEFLRAIYAKLDLITAGRYASSAALRQSPQTGLWLVQSDLTHIAAAYMAFAQWWFMPSTFTDILKIEDSQWWLLYATEKPALTQLFSEETCLALIPYLLQKWKMVSGWRENILAKSWTTGEWNKIRIVIVTPRFTLSIMVWPVVYTIKDPVTKKSTIVWWWTRDATSLLSPLVRNYLDQLAKLWYYSPDQHFFFQTQPINEPEQQNSSVIE